ncbi:MAG: hypothetical protein WCK63_13405 [Betaproteobacteria bacterium]
MQQVLEAGFAQSPDQRQAIHAMENKLLAKMLLDPTFSMKK